MVAGCMKIEHVAFWLHDCRRASEKIHAQAISRCGHLKLGLEHRDVHHPGVLHHDGLRLRLLGNARGTTYVHHIERRILQWSILPLSLLSLIRCPLSTICAFSPLYGP